jgi:glycine/D-amino acid oxidase-like deaminating enzyme
LSISHLLFPRKMHIVVIGCGIVGAAIAYELSQVPGLKVTVIDQKPPAQASTGAALGVLMGIISHKVKGKAWRMRQTSIATYEEWVPKLEVASGRKIPFNRQGILSLCLDEDDLVGWENLATTRCSQGWQLEIWNQSQLKQACPQVNTEKLVGAVYSPQDRQLDPTTLTLALVDAAILNGVSFKFGVEVLGVNSPIPPRKLLTNSKSDPSFAQYSVRDNVRTNDNDNVRANDKYNVRANDKYNVRANDKYNVRANDKYNVRANDKYNVRANDKYNVRANGRSPLQYGITKNNRIEDDTPESPAVSSNNADGVFGESIETSDGKIIADKFIIAAGLGSTLLTEQLQQKIDIRPVLGQAIHFHIGHALGNQEFQPVLTGNDVHIVPCGAGIIPTTDYWVGATVEFPNPEGNPLPPDAELLAAVKQQAISYCPELANATITRTWSGLRPRPENRPAPIIEKLPGFSNILLATGHYRNGVLLAPATAIAIREMILANS